MKSAAHLPEQWRPAVKNSLSRSPLLRATAALSLGAGLSILPHLPVGPTGLEAMVVLYALALTAFAVGGLTLLQSAAIRRIRHLHNSNKKQLDELSRSALYTEQIRHSLAELVEFRDQAQREDPLPLIERILESAAMRAAVAFDPSIRLYVVETTVSEHRVLARSGMEIFAIEPGKSCSTDRTLEEVARSLGTFSRIVPLSFRGARCHLVVLSDSQLTRADSDFVEQLALIFGLAEDKLPRGASQVHRSSGVKLRVV
ncbi:MAG TPA: hypothetical protein VNM38_03685 [Solirubrobacterales bacterium]|nr:hypothetical protein [Solirubrobacterales bacterium]